MGDWQSPDRLDSDWPPVKQPLPKPPSPPAPPPPLPNKQENQAGLRLPSAGTQQ